MTSPFRAKHINESIEGLLTIYQDDIIDYKVTL